ncbi:MAG: NAD-dependent epimerase/dehydratase family protein [Kiritimatiellae bacterium]|jgi:nucleoside-diphosphate-sugar epimerase|nr:NAD-dependent epimerase/dehydratase family protein [Kiritimatiellia bacterium]
MKKILITGAFGFVGSNLSAYLANKGYELWALDVKDSARVRKCESAKVGNSSSSYAREYNWEQLEKIPWREVYAVVHLAGKAHDTKNTSDSQSYFDINTGLTQKVLEIFSRKDAKAQRGGGSSKVLKFESSKVGADSAAGEFEVLHSTFHVPHPTNTLCASVPLREKRFILFSSVKAVADRVEGVLTEETQPDPQTPYGQSKLAAEKIVSEAPESNFRTSELSNFRTYSLRPCMIHGPGNKGNLNLLYNVVQKGIPWPLGAFENKRSFASIGNVCAVVEGLLSKDVKSGTFQVADDDIISTNRLIELMAEGLGRRARIMALPRGFVSLIAKVGDVLHLPLNSERLKKLTESYVVSNTKIKAALGWDKMPVGAREGMSKTLESFSE